MYNQFLLTESERRWINIAATWGKITERERCGDLSVPENIQKSALFRRLMSSKTPLAYRPPTSNSFPWYAVVEDPEIEHDVIVDRSVSMASKFNSDTDKEDQCISINGALWRIEETIQEGREYIVSWGQYPMRWRLILKREKNGSVAEWLESRKNLLQAHEPDSQKVKEDIQKLKQFLRDPTNGNIEVDEHGDCWNLHWLLQRIGLSGWPFAGQILPVNQKNLESIAADSQGDAILFCRRDDGSSNRHSEAWVRIEFDAETNIARYVSIRVIARSSLEALIQKGNDPEWLQFLANFAMSKHGEICVMDRQESSKEILRLYQTKERPAGFSCRKVDD
jgi:hypothetical protein